MDSTAQTAPRDSDIIIELLSRVTLGCDSANSHEGLGNHRSNCRQGLHMDSTAQTAPRDSEITNETTATGDTWIRQPTAPRDTNIINKTAARVDAWIGQRKQPQGTQK